MAGALNPAHGFRDHIPPARRAPGVCPILAEWYRTELFHPEATTLDEAEDRLSADGPDRTVVMLESGDPVGAASLLRENMFPLPEYGPWLGTVVVRLSRRGKGLGRAVVDEAVRRARAFGIRTLHL